MDLQVHSEEPPEPGFAGQIISAVRECSRLVRAD